MIVELNGTDLLKLANDEQITVGDVIVRPSQDGESKVSGVLKEQQPLANRSVYQRRAQAKAALTGDDLKPRWMEARFDGICSEDGCSNAIRKGQFMVRDRQERKNYCPHHGLIHFPELATNDPRVTA